MEKISDWKKSLNSEIFKIEMHFLAEFFVNKATVPIFGLQNNNSLNYKILFHSSENVQ